MQAAYHFGEVIKIIFDHIKTGQEFTIAGYSPLYYRKLANMGIFHILGTK